AAGVDVVDLLVPAGERSKSFSELEDLLDRMLSVPIGRDSTVLALGGGVVGDLAGFAASIALRGIDFVQIPTTLLAQVDSSVGGKTAIDTPHGKNLVGTFHQPRLVLADTVVLDRLPRRQLLAGYAEMVKTALICDAEFFAWLEENSPAVLGEGEADAVAAARRYAVAKCCRIKAEHVAADEREAGKRALLNLGHTFGHALEAELGYSDQLLHGEAVAIGMVMAYEMSARQGLCDVADVARVRAHLAAVGLPTAPPAQHAWSAEVLLGHMAHDKKVRDGKPVLILTRGIGEAFVHRDAGAADILPVLEAAVAA
ncbi:MAG: 3-dehydroquinate synthase, partial [Alphaproteobacteria bacterium]|nr:3-dehydroquinate synthase [Alphaproteobacteria bacterium]